MEAAAGSRVPYNAPTAEQTESVYQLVHDINNLDKREEALGELRYETSRASK